ncbi:MAG: hydroxymethylbilane synthase [Blastocatellia bacterium]
MPNLIIGSRGSRLALWQARHVQARLQRLHPEITIEIEIIRTTGDRMTEASLAQIGGKGVFTKEIEEALLEQRIDLAVHSLKDLPTTLPDGLMLAAITEREDVRDALIVHAALPNVKTIEDLPQGARVGTSSLRRMGQLRIPRPDLRIMELRGNVETRLAKLDRGEYDAIVLACAGLLRLNLGDRITQRIPVETLLPAVGQAALGIETRMDDPRAIFLVEALNHGPARYAAEAERAVLRALGGGCAVPVAAHGFLETVADSAEQTLLVEALVCAPDGSRFYREKISGKPMDAEDLGARLARNLNAAGASEILERVRSGELIPQFAPPEPIPPEMQAPAPATEQTPTNDGSGNPGFPLLTAAGRSLEVATQRPAPVPGMRAMDTIMDTMMDTMDVAVSRPDGGSTDTRMSMPEIRPTLLGRRVIVTRAARQAGELLRLLQDHGAEVIPCPTIEIRPPSRWEPLDNAIEQLDQYHWLMFTSANGVENFLTRLDARGLERSRLSRLTICAVGRKTAQRLLDEGLRVDLTPARFTAENLAETFLRQYGNGDRLRGKKVLLPSARATRDVIRPALTPHGVIVDMVEAYQTVLPKNSEDISRIFAPPAPDYVIFTSPSTVTNLATLLGAENLLPWLSQTRIACIGPVTAESAQLHGLTVHVQPGEQTSRGLVLSLLEDLRQPAGVQA